VSDRFRSIADALGVEVEVTHYPDGTRTAADAARAIGCELGAIVKSLVFVVDPVGPVLALTSGANRVDVKKLGPLFGGGKARQASADEAREATGFAIGGTPPFGASLPTVIDEALLQYDTVWAAAGTPDTCFPIAPQRLIDVTRAQVAEFAAG
jgi:Cys-tRNA(Pro) deacylase